MHYYVIGSGGTLKLDIDIELPAPVMMHDFAITEDYAVFLDFPLTINQEVRSPVRIWKFSSIVIKPLFPPRGKVCLQTSFL
jgi:carotenoid cleavage dioxygenase-like enzyme